ncbi:MAG: response regulator [Aeromicrobium sp.]|nr:response regulator [Burkholderiales bacterium]
MQLPPPSVLSKEGVMTEDSPLDRDALSASAAKLLRQKAEDIASAAEAASSESLKPLSPEATRQTLHDLRVYQIELEMQNEELRRAQLALDTSRAQYFDLYDLAPVGYCTISEQGLILQANLKAAVLFGVARSALATQPFSRFIVRDDQDTYYQFRKRLIETEEAQCCDLRIAKHDGTPRWTELAATTVLDDDGARIVRLVLNDISDRKKVEAEREALEKVLVDKNTDLENARSVAEKANLAKSDFLSSMSHELRTPLNAILGFSQLLASDASTPTPSQQRSIDQVLKAGWYLLELVNEILDLAVIESGKLSLSMEPVSLADVLRECENMVDAQAKMRGIDMTFPQLQMPCFVLADRIRLKQVVINLLSNAIKYNKAGGAVIVECAAGAPDSIRISIRDTGKGLDPKQLPQLFQPFNRLGQDSGVIEGTGIGLVVSKRLIEFMRGIIGVESSVGQGSVFWIELKLTTEVPQPAAVLPVQIVRAESQLDAPLRTLLYIEDNPANLLLVEELIARRPNIRFLSGTDGISGIEIARSAIPDVILMDINLPGISGIDALKMLSEMPETAHIPVIALSANAMPNDIEKGLKAGFLRYLTKPIKIHDFMGALDVSLKFSKKPTDNMNTEGRENAPTP